MKQQNTLAQTQTQTQAQQAQQAQTQQQQHRAIDTPTKMNTNQQLAYDAFFKRENLLITGSAGTGKSFVLLKIHQAASKLGLKVGMTGTTGSSSHLINGRTIHSFLGVGLARGSAEQLAMVTMTKNKAMVKKLLSLDALVIEEISMMDQVFFEKVSDYLSIIRKNPKPFGGLQLLMLGDFCQLPPVKLGTGQFCFKSQTWSQLNLTTVRLVELVRQVDDPAFQAILEKVRWGRCGQETLDTIRSWIRRPSASMATSSSAAAAAAAVRPTRLYPTNADVDTINDHEYMRLTEDDDVPRKVYETTYGSQQARTWATSCKIPERVRLCIGAQVVVTWNINQAQGIVNGSRGVVVAVNAKSVTIKDVRGRLITIDPVTITDNNLSVTYMPLRLAYALTIHRCQGMTLDSVVIDLGSSIFEYGQAYTALSRVRNSDSLSLIAVEASSFMCHPDVLEFYGEN